MELYYSTDKLEAGIDEVARGCLAGPVYAAAVIWPKELDETDVHFQLRDSKKLSKKRREFLKDYIPPTHPSPPVTTWIESEVGAEIKIGIAAYLTITARYQLKSMDKASVTDTGIGIRFWSYFQLPFNK